MSSSRLRTPRSDRDIRRYQQVVAPESRTRGINMPYYYTKFRHAIENWIDELPDMKYDCHISTQDFRITYRHDALFTSKDLFENNDKINCWNFNIPNYIEQIKQHVANGRYDKVTRVLLACLEESKQIYVFASLLDPTIS